MNYETMGVSKSAVAKVAKILRRNTETPGITLNRLADRAGLAPKTAYNAISALRIVEGKAVYRNTRLFQGKRKNYYRLAV